MSHPDRCGELAAGGGGRCDLPPGHVGLHAGWVRWAGGPPEPEEPSLNVGSTAVHRSFPSEEPGTNPDDPYLAPVGWAAEAPAVRVPVLERIERLLDLLVLERLWALERAGLRLPARIEREEQDARALDAALDKARRAREDAEA